METVREVLKQKGRQVWSVGPDTTVYEALELMAEKEIGAVLVLLDDEVVGIFSERDYARQVTLKNRSAKDTLMRDVMTAKILCVEPKRTVEECMALMTDKRIRHLPVLEAGKVAGLLSIGDIVKAVISEKRFTIEQLQHYITGA